MNYLRRFVLVYVGVLLVTIGGTCVAYANAQDGVKGTEKRSDRVSEAVAAIQVVCGDFNGNGSLNVADMNLGFEYLYAGGAPPADPAMADADGYDVYTQLDLMVIVDRLFAGGSLPFCPPALTSLDTLPPDPDNYITVSPSSLPAGDSIVRVSIRLTNDRPLRSFSLPLRIRFCGAVPLLIDSIDAFLPAVGQNATARYDSANGTLFVYYIGGNYPPSDTTIATFRVHTTKNTQVCTEMVDTLVGIAPFMAGGASNVPLLVHDFGAFLIPMRPDLRGTDVTAVCQCSGCCIQPTRGDVNYNGIVTVADLTFLINFLFNSGLRPPCFDEANVNGVGQITVADLTYLVNFLFAGGPSPAACP